VKLLGSGGMGDVFLAEHVLLGRKMAVKVLKSDLSQNQEVVQRFQQEAMAAGQIGQENIVSVTDFGHTADGAFFFVMEALAGETLSALLVREKSLPVGRAVSILLQVSRALIAAHAQGIVHRDLKADNVMVMPRDDGTDLVKVLDFGISKVANAGGRVTQMGVVMGTPDYMSPQQARGEAVDHRTDIYSFGVLAYELLTGSVPFQAAHAVGVMYRQIHETPAPPSMRAPQAKIPPVLEGLILKALQKDPDHRQASMTELRDTLLTLAPGGGGAPVATSREPVLSPSVVPGNYAPTLVGRAAASASTSQPVAPGRRRRVLAGIALATVGLALAGAAVFAFSSRHAANGGGALPAPTPLAPPLASAPPPNPVRTPASPSPAPAPPS
jgi:serine/threonine-protein kinase